MSWLPVALGAAVAAFYFAHRAVRGSSTWGMDDIPSLEGKRALITGGNVGLGLETARYFLKKGASVTITARSRDRGEAALRQLNSPNASLELADLADLESIDAFGDRLVKQGLMYDITVLNAGVSIPPESYTLQGFELQFGTNHLGHFFLVEKLLPILRGRVVVVSSLAATSTSKPPLDFSKIAKRQGQKYDALACYGDSKLCNLLFAAGLQQRNNQLLVTASHSGMTATDLQRDSRVFSFVNTFLVGPDIGALTQVRAAVDDAAKPLDWFGPGGLVELQGRPIRAKPLPEYTRDQNQVDGLWKLSEQLVADWKASGKSKSN